MKEIFSVLIISLLFYNVNAQLKVRINIQSLPSSIKTGKIFIAGSFNNWNPKDSAAAFNQDSSGHFFYEHENTNAGLYEFKFTRGDWQNVECKKDGSEIENRSVKIISDTVFNFSVEAWKDQFPEKIKQHTASKNVHIIDTLFFIPQLKRCRRIWAYIPADYYSSEKKYPVLYMHDGQNLFDEFTSAYGEWGVDELMDSLSKKIKPCIIIGIDNGNEKRMNEYNPYDQPQFGKGEGDGYIDFLVQTLKPFIDKKYRTLNNTAHTFIAGSSMGGLISLYAILKYPNVFGGAGVFSPALWTAPQLSGDVKKLSAHAKGKIYFYAGDTESETMVSDMLHIFELLRKNAKVKMKVSVKAGGKHNEANWHREFPDFYKWVIE
jgi:predicted alpha/beta superfamily hydrolase